jgi:hypothetical protein
MRRADLHSLLRVRWGDRFDARIAAIDALIEGAAAKLPCIATLVDRMPWELGDSVVAQWLVTIAQNRARRQGAQNM